MKITNNKKKVLKIKLLILNSHKINFRKMFYKCDSLKYFSIISKDEPKPKNKLIEEQKDNQINNLDINNSEEINKQSSSDLYLFNGTNNKSLSNTFYNAINKFLKNPVNNEDSQPSSNPINNNNNQSLSFPIISVKNENIINSIKNSKILKNQINNTLSNRIHNLRNLLINESNSSYLRDFYLACDRKKILTFIFKFCEFLYILTFLNENSYRVYS
jgi:hypothetical protein